MKAELIDHMGDDLRVVNAARVSFDKESFWVEVEKWVDDYLGTFPVLVKELNPRDQGLIKYLASHAHWTPFAHPQITMRETVPIFVARQRFKHMVGFIYNEVSRRYVDDDPEFFEPVWRKRPDKSIKQGSGEAFGNADQELLMMDLRDHHQNCLWLYNTLLKINVAPEQARMVLPQSMYTSYYTTGSLAAWARAYNLRKDRSKAQHEIADLAEEWNKIIQPLFPVAWAALTSESTNE